MTDSAMRLTSCCEITRAASAGVCLCVGALIFSNAGCSKSADSAPKTHVRPEATAVSVQKRTIVRETGQPGFIQAYEQTAIYPKISGFVDAWKVDIGDAIRKDQLLAHLDVPDLVAEYEEKTAERELDEVRIQVAEQFVKVADENLKTATAQVEEAKADLGKAKADVERWKVDFSRITALVKAKSIDETVQDESRKRLETSIAALQAAEAGIVVVGATKDARQADVQKARADVDAARAKAKVSRATEKRLAALVGYTTIKAPYDGTVVTRNVNTGDFIRPASGDETDARTNSGASRASSPLYVVARTDKVRIFLDVPEMDANGIEVGSKAHVSIQAVDNLEFPAEVTRTSWALSAKSRTLRTEIDIPNSEGRIRPNMYAYGTVQVTRADVWAVPLQAVIQRGNQTCCYVLEGDKSVLLPVQLGIDDGAWVEVSRKRVGDKWVPFDGSERILTGALSQLSDGESVRIAAPTAPTK